LAEYLDILDEEGNKTGKTKLRSEVHRDGDWHRSVHIWIINTKNELLIQKRSPNKKTHPNFLDLSVAGHVSAGDGVIDSAIREIKEELGISIDPSELEQVCIYQQKYNENGFNNNQFNNVFLLKKDIVTKNAVLQKEEVAEIKFIPYQELVTLSKSGTMVPHPQEYQIILDFLNERLKIKK